MDRRNFMKEIAVGGTGALIPWVPHGTERVQLSVTAQKYKFLTTEEATTMIAICEQIIPRDEYPGAKESGVVDYIDSVLSGRMGRFYKGKYRKGLASVEEISQKRHRKDFAALSSKDQTVILRDFESGAAAGAVGKSFFLMVVGHTMEGYYGDPSHGGNRGSTSWKMINFKG
jgi:gluconate 2-dehydrogenase gamma chain